MRTFPLLTSLVLVLALAACGASKSSTPATDDPESTCPAATDPCMDADNHQQCLDKEAACPGQVMQLESCPLQFACPE